jgi:hypothetical protein
MHQAKAYLPSVPVRAQIYGTVLIFWSFTFVILTRFRTSSTLHHCQFFSPSRLVCVAAAANHISILAAGVCAFVEPACGCSTPSCASHTPASTVADSTGAARSRCKSGHTRAPVHGLVRACHQRVSKPFAGTELIYCVLSLTAKLYLGTFLLINVRTPKCACLPWQPFPIRTSTR